MNSFKLLFVILLCCISESMWAQESQGDPYQYNPSEKMFLPTPEQASLMKFTNIPAGNHTGVFGYSIPIYTLQGKEFSLPISIDYHGMGIKVNEMASSTGIGWALSIGGISLSEEVRGERDASMGPNRLSYFVRDNFQPNEMDNNQAYRDGLGILAIGSLDYHPTKEQNPDYFSYSLLNNSGKFMLDNNNKAHTIPKDNVKIIGNHSFTLTDSKGLIYHFSVYEQENATYGNGMNSYGGIVDNRVSYGHKLESIEIPHSGETILFDYYMVKYAYFSSHTVTDKIYTSQTTSNIAVIDHGGSNTYGRVTEYLPKSITYNRTKVEFKYKMDGSKFLDREDVDNVYDNVIMGDAGGILEYIEVYDIANNSKIKNYKLLTDYFVSPNESLPNIGAGYDRTPWKKRLKLEGIQELISETDYEFEYYGESEGKVLPPRFSYKTDYWGMYNGKENSTELPDFVFESFSRKHYFPGADKRPDSAFAKIGSLKKVKLPTGGSQIFEYEQDEYNNRIDREDDEWLYPVYDYEARNYTIFEESFPYSSATYNDHTINITPPSPDFREGFSHVLTFSTNDPPETVDSPDDLPSESYFYVQLFETGNPVALRQTFMNGDIELPELDPQKTYYIKLKRQYFGNEPNYVTHPDYMSIFISLKWVDENITYPKNRSAGTLRVKAITLNDAAGSPQIKRTYSYKEFGKPDFSSGNYTGRRLDHYYSSSESGKYHLINVSNSDIYNLSQSFGKSVLYENVTETYESTDPAQVSENHKKEYIFSETATQGYDALSAPVLPQPHDYSGGRLLEERIYNSSSQLLRVTKNEYSFDTFFNLFSGNRIGIPEYSIPSVLSTALIISMGGHEPDHPFVIKWYDITSAWIKLLKTTVDEYENGTRVRTNTTEYTYNEGTGAQNEFKSILPASVTTGTSMATDNGSYVEKIKTVYKYPQDLTGGTQGSLMQALKDANRISEPVKTEKFKIKSGTETQLSELYMKYGANLLPSEVHFRSDLGDIDLNSITDRKVRYSRYDANGNIEEFIMEDGTPVSIVWGYNKQFPIAKVEGVPYSVVETYITNIVNDSNGDTTNCIGLSGCNEATLRVSLNTFRKQTAFSDALITTYTYDPLLGVTSITQPNGQVEYYKYDSAGRLELIHDKDLNVLKNMRDNYKD